MEVRGVAPVEDDINALETIDHNLGIAEEVGQGGLCGGAHGRDLL